MTKKILLIVFLIFLVGFIVRFYQLDSLPGEIYGDIALVYVWTEDILSGRGLPPFFLSVGPVYFYLLAPFIKIFGDSYLGLKSFSSLIGIITILTTYFLARNITDNKYIALLASFFLAVSKWHIIFSRVGHQIIITSLFSSLTFVFLIRFLKYQTLVNLFLIIIFAGLSMYTYVSAWAIPLVVIISLLLSFITFGLSARQKMSIFAVLLVGILLISMPLVFTIFKNKLNFFGRGGYIGDKLFVEKKEGPPKFFVWLLNMKNSLLMFNVRGDSTFRSNPPSEPHLDQLTGLFFLIGIIIILLKQRRYIPFTLIPILILILPASLVVNSPDEVPSSARTLTVVPFVMITSGIGLSWTLSFLRRYLKFIIPGLLISFLFGCITYLNLKSYFFTYQENLPNKNAAFGKIIARKIDTLPISTNVYVDGCCWAAGGEPEPNGIIHALNEPRKIKFFSAHDNQRELSCEQVEVDLDKHKELFFVISPLLLKDIDKLRDCLPGGKEEVLTSNGFNVAWIYLYSSSNL